MLPKPSRRPAAKTAPAATGAVRIIGGRLRGSKLPVLEHPGLRPTPDRVRETLFNWLRPVLPGAQVLDLFAGTGALAIEALSQGAASAVLVESERKVAEHLRAQLTRLRLEAQCTVEIDGAQRVLGRIAQRFDLILLDPPYAAALWADCLQQIAARQLLKAMGQIYLEWPADQPEPAHPGYEWAKRSRGGKVEFGLLREAASDDPSHAAPLNK